MREIDVSRAGDPVHVGDKALTWETPAQRGRANRYQKGIILYYKKGGGIWQGKQQIGFMLYLKKGGGGRYGKGNRRKALFCTLKKGGIWQGKQQIGFILCLNKTDKKGGIW